MKHDLPFPYILTHTECLAGAITAVVRCLRCREHVTVVSGEGDCPCPGCGQVYAIHVESVVRYERRYDPMDPG